MRARGREIIIITAVIIVVVIVAWWFLFFNPVRKDISSLNDQISAAQSRQTSAQTTLKRLKGYQKTSPQTEADLLRYNKMMPSQTGVPGIIIELQRTAEDNQLTFVGITPGAVSAGNPFSVQSITLSFTGGFYAFQDFLAAVEQYVQYQNDEFLVTGRLLSVTGMSLAPVSSDTGSSSSTDLTIGLNINAYLWSGVSPSGASTGTPLPAAPTPAPSASASPTASASPSATVSPSATATASPSATSTETASPSATSTETASASPTSSTSPTTEASP